MRTIPIASDVFCNIPYSSLVISPDGSYRICSLMNDRTSSMGACMDDNGVVMNVMTHSFEEALNGKWNRYLRAQQLNGQKDAMCECCYERDAIDGFSRRANLLHVLPRRHPDYINANTAVQVTKEDGTFVGKLVSLDLRLGNLCNLSCITCGPWYSNQWYSDYQAVTGRTHFKWGGRTIKIESGERITNTEGGEPWWETDVWWKRLHAAKQDLKHIYVTAGEPLLVKAFRVLLQILVDSDCARNIVVELDTNLTVSNPKVWELLKHFKRVNLRVSIDDLHERYSVFRYPGKFETVDQNLRSLLADRDANMHVMITSCLTPLNVFYVKEIEDYASEVKTPWPAHFRFVDSPSRFDLRSLSPTKKSKIIQHLEVSDSPWSKKVCAYLRNSYLVHRPDDEKDLIKFMCTLDNLRGHEWRTIYPQASALMEMD